MNLSYWELKSWFTNVDFTIVGSGIVGLNCALNLKQKYPKFELHHAPDPNLDYKRYSPYARKPLNDTRNKCIVSSGKTPQSLSKNKSCSDVVIHIHNVSQGNSSNIFQV